MEILTWGIVFFALFSQDVNTNYAYLVSSGGSEEAPGVNIQDSTTLFLRWRHSQNHFYRTTSTVLEFYGGRGYE